MDAKHHDMSATSLSLSRSYFLVGPDGRWGFSWKGGVCVCVCEMNGAGLVYWVQAALMAFTQVTHQ